MKPNFNLKYTAVIFFLLQLAFAFAQTGEKPGYEEQQQVDSVKLLLKNAAHDTTRAAQLIALADLYIENDQFQAFTCCSEALKLTDKIIADKNETVHRRGLTIKATCLNNLGFIYRLQGNIPKAIDYYFEAVRIFEATGDDKSSLATCFNNLGVIYSRQGDQESALNSFRKGLKIYEAENDQKGIAQCYHSMALSLKLQGKLIEALEYYDRSLAIREKLKDPSDIGTSYNNLGFLFMELDNKINARSYFFKSLEVYRKTKSRPDLAMAYNNLGNFYLKDGKPDSAFYFFKKSEEVLDRIKLSETRGTTAKGLYDVYKIKGSYKEALYYYEIYKDLMDSIYNRKNKSAALKAQLKYDFEKKEAISQAENTKKELERLEEVKRQRIIMWSIVAGLLIIVGFSFSLYKRFKLTQAQNLVIVEQKTALQEKNQEITDSIVYARRIQQALLASSDLLKDKLKDHFVLYKPKAIVSGDFYWASTVNDAHTGNELFALCTADCTGHGVPGAFMSLLNISFLNEAVNEKKTASPDAVLNHTRARIIKALSTDGSEEGGKDGMDCTLCVYDSKSNILKMACANNPVWIVRGKELIEIKPDKFPVGKHDKDSTSFTLHEMQLQTGDCVYTFTDGYADQFGGPKGKKFKYKPLQELLISNAGKPMSEQKDILYKAIEGWRGELEQIDDLLVIGIRV